MTEHPPSNQSPASAESQRLGSNNASFDQREQIVQGNQMNVAGDYIQHRVPRYIRGLFIAALVLSGLVVGRQLLSFYIASTQKPTYVYEPTDLDRPYKNSERGDICDSAWKRIKVDINTNSYYAYVTAAAFQDAPRDLVTMRNKAKWRPDLPQAGTYKVEAYIPPLSSVNWPCPQGKGIVLEAKTSQATYTIFSAEKIATVMINQSSYDDQWAELGKYQFNTGTNGYIELIDATSEPLLTRSIVFSAIRFTLEP